MPDSRAADGGLASLLGQACQRLDEVRAVAAAAGCDVDVERIIEELRGPGDVGDRPRQLDQLLRNHGVAAGLAGVVRGAGIGGLPPLDGHPVEEALMCPRRRCARVALIGDPEPARSCLLYGEPLRARRLRS